LIGFGDLARFAVRSFGPAGQHFDNLSELADAVSATLGPDVTVLIKGSRSMGLERLVATLVADGGNE
jgi:UDP-N-acetylmuramoyl-tripeptide--D-alanyl-D-alanine ligase